MQATFKIEGMEKLIHDIEELGKLPQKHVTAAARKGMTKVKNSAKSSAPYDTGMLKQGIILNGEKSRYRGKKVYEVIFDPKMNDVFQGKSKFATKKVLHRKNGKRWIAHELKDYYYPISQEYGYFLRNGQYMPGLRFIHDSLVKNAELIAVVMTEDMQKKIDAEIRKAGLR